MIIFLYGEDTYRSRQKLKELKDKFLREVDPGGSGLMQINGETATLSAINEIVSSSSLFAKKRMIVVERIFANKKKTLFDQLSDYLKQNSKNENIIIFWDDITGSKMSANKLFKFLDKQQYAQNFKPLSNTEATAWVKKAGEARGAKIGQPAAMLLTGIFGNDLWQLHNEIDKLISYHKGRNKELISGAEKIEITADDVENLARGKADENIFAFTDALGNKNKALAIKLFENELAAGLADTYLLHMIIRQFRILLQTRQALDQGLSSRQIVSKLKLHPFVAQKCLYQVRNFSLASLKNIFKSLVDIDRQIKIGETDFKVALLLLLAKI